MIDLLLNNQNQVYYAFTVAAVGVVAIYITTIVNRSYRAISLRRDLSSLLTSKVPFTMTSKVRESQLLY
jgi:hypothetical protein